jgi:hypothetical protein
MSALFPDLFQWAAANRFNDPAVEATISISLDREKKGHGACTLSYVPPTIYPHLLPASFLGQPFALAGQDVLQQPVVVQIFAPSFFIPLRGGPWPSYQLVISTVVMTGTGPTLIPQAQNTEDPADEGTAENPQGTVPLSGNLLSINTPIINPETITVGLLAA